MFRKNLATTITTILCAMLFIVIGSCFSTFLYQKEMIRVEDPNLIIAEGMNVLSAQGDKTISTLSLSKMKLGLKPATGEENPNTNIPSTVIEKQGSEGQYAKFKLFAPNGVKLFVTNVVIKSDKDMEKINKEKEHIMVAIKEIENSATNLVDEKVELGSLSASDERQELTFYVWLSGKTSNILESSTISFDLLFENLI